MHFHENLLRDRGKNVFSLSAKTYSESVGKNVFKGHVVFSYFEQTQPAKTCSKSEK